MWTLDQIDWYIEAGQGPCVFWPGKGEADQARPAIFVSASF